MVKLVLLACVFTGAQGLSQELQAVLDQHNLYRCMHGVSPLEWDNVLANNAQLWVNKGHWGHSQTPGVGENLAWGSPSMKGEDAVQNWYNEIGLTSGGGGLVDAQTGAPGGTGHYTQVVWKNSNKVGCAKGMRTGRGGDYWVCQYKEPGNVWGQYAANVLAPSKTAEKCKANSDIDSATPDSGLTYTDENIVCRDNAFGFLDSNGYSCEGWAGHHPCSSYSGYSESDMADVRENCPGTCGLCGNSECVNDKSFADIQGWRCSDWQTGQCEQQWGGYSEADMAALRTHCQLSCGLCNTAFTRLSGDIEEASGTYFGAASLAGIVLTAATLSLAVVAARKLRQRDVVADEEMLLETSASRQPDE